MQDIQQWLSNRVGTSDRNGRRMEPTLSHSCANTFIKDLATALKEEANL